MLRGYEVDFVIGFQCYGHNVVNQALEEKRQEDPDEKDYFFFSGDSYRNKFTRHELTEIVNAYIAKQVKNYLVSLHRWGLMTNYSQIYTTMSPDYIDSMLECFQSLIRMKYLRRSHLPQFILPSTLKLIPSTEIEYESELKFPHYFVRYRVVDYGENDLLKDQFPDLYFIAFISEPWALQGMEALAIHPDIVYSIVMVGNEFYVISKGRLQVHRQNLKDIGKGNPKTIKNVNGEALGQLKVENFMTGQVKDIVPDRMIRNSYGSGVNVVCPGVYVDDFKIGQQNDLNKDFVITKNGKLLSDIPEISGKKVPAEANHDIKFWLVKNKHIFNFYEDRDFYFMRDKVSKQRAFLYAEEVWALKTDPQDLEDIVEELNQRCKQVGVGESPNFRPVQEYLLNRETEWCIR
jgi:isoleucyl-tRNA synthetase